MTRKYYVGLVFRLVPGRGQKDDRLLSADKSPDLRQSKCGVPGQFTVNDNGIGFRKSLR